MKGKEPTARFLPLLFLHPTRAEGVQTAMAHRKCVLIAWMENRISYAEAILQLGESGLDMYQATELLER